MWAFAYLQYAGFNVFNTILGGESLATVTHGGTKPWYVVVTLLAFVVALVGYDFIHRVERWLTYTFLVVFGVFTVGALITLHFPSGATDLGAFHWTPFLAQFGVVAGYQISWAIYLSDYSRYLPPDVTVRRTSLWTYWGSALGAIWLMCLGTILAAAITTGSTFDTVTAIKISGDKIFSGFGDIVLVFAALGLISVTALNMYGGSLTLISAIDSFRKVRPTLAVRALTISFTAVLSLIGVFAASQKLPEQLRELPAADPLPVHPLDGSQPRRLLHRAARSLRRGRDLQPTRHVRPLGLAGDPRLWDRLRGHGAFLQHRSVHRSGRQIARRGGHLAVHRPARGRHPVLVLRANDRCHGRDRHAREELADLERVAAQHLGDASAASEVLAER